MSKPDLDDYGAVLAVMRLSGRRASERKSVMADQTRRDLLKITIAGAIAAPLAAAEQPPKFFTPEEFQMVDQLAELIIPADDHSPGAHDAQVAAYIDRRL